MPPNMYPTPSRRGRAAPVPGSGHHRPTPQFQQQRPAQPSSAAAKAAAAAKALHRRAQERAKTKQQEEEKRRTSFDGSGQSSRPPSEQRNDVFRRSPNQEASIEGQKIGGGSILKKMTTGQSYRVGPAKEDATYEAKSSSAGTKSAIAAGASMQPSYPPGHPGAHYQHHPHMMYGHPPPYGHPHYPYTHPHYHHLHHQERQNAKSNDDGADASKGADLNKQHPYYGHSYPGHQYPPHPSYYDGRNYSSYPHYHGQNHHQFYNPYHRAPAPTPGADNAKNDGTRVEAKKLKKTSTAPSGPPLEEQQISSNARGATRHVIGSHTSIHVPRESMMDREEKTIHSSEKEPLLLPSNTAQRDKTIFRYGENEDGRDLLESTEILLSLSKSFDRNEGNKHKHNTRGSAKKESASKKKPKKAKKEEKVTARTTSSSKQLAKERPKSPPRIHHFHKQANVSSFEVSH